MTTYDIIPASLAVTAMRDNGYKNAAYALAELMDNSIQAKATLVELLIGEKEEYLPQRTRSRVYQIGVLDNGIGMDSEVLQISLQFGNGLYLNTKDPNSIGRFGMGLPNSSISQAKKVEVWTWQNGVENAIYSYLDVREIERGEISQVPDPIKKGVPEIWLKAGEPTGKTGTLVVWSNIDRCMWKTGKAIIENSEFAIGRTYRRFLDDKRIKINLKIFDVDGDGKPHTNRPALPNDPLYMMPNTSCPAPFNNQPMFQEWGNPMTFVIRFNGGEYQVKVKFTVAKEEARKGFNPGGDPHGKHAAKNLGVSVMRADRELDLDSSWTNPSEPRDRWWGAEIDFPPALDDLFGVTNNKQSARNFTRTDFSALLMDEMEEGQTLESLKAELEAEQDPRLPLIEIANHLQKNINSMRRWLKAQTSSGSKRKRHDEKPTEEVATEATQKRKDEGFTGESDKQEKEPADQREAEIRDELITQGVTEESAGELAATTVGRGLKYTFAKSSLDNPSFFNVTSRGGAILVTLNTDHPAYSKLVEVLEDDTDDVDVDTLKERLSSARDGLQLLFMAWARYEDEQPAGIRRNNAKDARWDWGRVARQFLDED